MVRDRSHGFNAREAYESGERKSAQPLQISRALLERKLPMPPKGYGGKHPEPAGELTPRVEALAESPCPLANFREKSFANACTAPLAAHAWKGLQKESSKFVLYVTEIVIDFRGNWLYNNGVSGCCSRAVSLSDPDDSPLGTIRTVWSFLFPPDREALSPMIAPADLIPRFFSHDVLNRTIGVSLSHS